MPPPPVGSQGKSRGPPRANQSSQGPLTQGMSQNMMSQPGFSGLDFSQNDFTIDESQGDNILSQDFTNSQGPDKFYGNFTQSQNF